MLAELRIPVSLPKLEGPSTTVTFLGIVLVQGSDQFLVIEAVWSLESLLGHLSHAAVAVKPGRIFLRHLFFQLAKVDRRHHFVHLNAMAKADLALWDSFLQDWHGAAL